MLKIYIFGYLNRIPSNRRLERECQRNVEMMWLKGRLAPDFKTIADFRRDNGPATSGRGSGIVGYNVQAAVDAKHRLVVEHEVTNVGNDHGQLSRMALSAKNAMGKAKLFKSAG